MKKTVKTATLAMTFAFVLPILASAAPRSTAEGRDWSDNFVVRAVKTIKKLVVKALEGPMIPPPSSDGQH